MYYALLCEIMLNVNYYKEKFMIVPLIKAYKEKPKKCLHYVYLNTDNINTAYDYYISIGLIYQDNYAFISFTDKFINEYVRGMEV